MTVRIEELQAEGMKKNMPQFKSGQTVRVLRKIREGDKERTQTFEGLIIEVNNQNNVSATITVRKIVGGIGVEQVFPVHSPLVEKIEVVKEAKVRRSRLYFMRNLRGKAARLKERFLTAEELQAMTQSVTEEVSDEVIEEAVEAEAKAEEEKKEEAAA